MGTFGKRSLIFLANSKAENLIWVPKEIPIMSGLSFSSKPIISSLVYLPDKLSIRETLVNPFFLKTAASQAMPKAADSA